MDAQDTFAPIGRSSRLRLGRLPRVRHKFHCTIVGAAGNPFLQRTALSLYVLGVEYCRVASEAPGVLRQSLAHHEAIVAALVARDPDATAAAMREHMHNVHRSTLGAMNRA